MKAGRQKSRHIRGKMLILLDRGVTRPIKTVCSPDMKYNYIVANYCVYYFFFFVTFKVIPIIYKDEILISRVYGQQTVTLKMFAEIFLYDSAVKWPNVIWATTWGSWVSWLDWQNWRWPILIQMTCMGNQGQLVSFMYLHKCYVKANKNKNHYLTDLKNWISTSLWLGRALKTHRIFFNVWQLIQRQPVYNIYIYIYFHPTWTDYTHYQIGKSLQITAIHFINTQADCTDEHNSFVARFFAAGDLSQMVDSWLYSSYIPI